MNERMCAWRRRHVLGGLLGASAALATPAMLRAAPSGQPVKVGGTLSLTGFLAQTAVIHKIAAEIMVEEINGRNGFMAGRSNTSCSMTSPIPTLRAASMKS
jgi:branched-chain amino acid transport system substrate-binding protein